MNPLDHSQPPIDQKPYPKPEVQTEAKIHVSNILAGISAYDLSQIFAPYGHVVEAVILKRPNPRNRHCRGALVRMSPREAGELAIRELNGKMWHGYALRVKLAKCDPGSLTGSDDDDKPNAIDEDDKKNYNNNDGNITPRPPIAPTQEHRRTEGASALAPTVGEGWSQGSEPSAFFNLNDSSVLLRVIALHEELSRLRDIVASQHHTIVTQQHQITESTRRAEEAEHQLQVITVVLRGFLQPSR